jgi:uracil-DNA glycosylase
MEPIRTFINKLATADRFDSTTNPFSLETRDNSIRRENLYAYLSQMYDLKPTALLVSEAPGYNGMRRTGIPFTSERILILHSFFKNKQYNVVDERHTKSEPSATIVWKTLDQVHQPLLMWPAFPFHPYKNGNMNSNRPPRQKELQFGEVLLRELIQLFRIKMTVAVGRKAERTLRSLGYRDIQYIRHPSQGGATAFHTGITRFFNQANQPITEL